MCVVISYHDLTSTTLKRRWEGAWGSATLNLVQPNKKPRCASLRDVAADTDAADGPHGLGMQCHCTGMMLTGRACSDRPGFAKFARVTEMLVVPDENCGVAPRMGGASGRPVTPIYRAGSIN